ncbi:oligosaccharide flippase family protein [Chelatococcus sp. SYSU_G07232]|uniref:Oligosaccharide flippase family protein n=1 Tax=Chelatococcus albus TaxID=3047466 RepID=A0ABT7ACK4_9HYPH|nr:oligosaccharide flippase family protein [Chelatococcus sp. SYSU_G07232]MDJ1157084.1 oligosaccharide flippase family protein [Chelatococcus sp. SYSU_G07232]
MTAIRRALIVTSAERYLNSAVNFLLIAAVSRLLTPEEIGVSVIGATIFGFAEVLRDIPSNYLVQKADLTREDVRTTFTLLALVSLMFAGALTATSAWIAGIYEEAHLQLYLQVLAFAFLPGAFERPVTALLRRDMAFPQVAVANVARVAVNGVVTVGLALLGFSYMSFAWAALAGGLTAAALAIRFGGRRWIFMPLFSNWRAAVRFGGSYSVAVLLATLYDLLPYVLLSRLHRLEDVGFYNRARMLSLLPHKLILSSFDPVALPALAAEARAGRELKQPYLNAITHITVVQWPALLVLTILAHPAIALLYGPQWIEIVPLAQIIAAAMLLSFTGGLNAPVLIAVGALRDLAMAFLICLPISGAIVTASAFFGTTALALSMFVTVPLNGYVTQRVIRRHVPYAWSELGGAVWPSALVALCSAAGPLALIVVNGLRFDLSLGAAVIAAILAAAGWLAGLRLTRHPMLDELLQVADGLRRSDRAEEAARAGTRILRWHHASRPRSS